MERILHIECCLPHRYRKKEILNLVHFSFHKMESTPQNGLKFQCSSYSVAPCSKRHARPGIRSGYFDAAWLWRRWLPLKDFDSDEIRSFVQNYSGHQPTWSIFSIFFISTLSKSSRFSVVHCVHAAEVKISQFGDILRQDRAGVLQVSQSHIGSQVVSRAGEEYSKHWDLTYFVFKAQLGPAGDKIIS